MVDEPNINRVEIPDKYGRIGATLTNNVRSDRHDCRSDYEDPLTTKAGQYATVTLLGIIMEEYRSRKQSTIPDICQARNLEGVESFLYHTLAAHFGIQPSNEYLRHGRIDRS